MDTKVMRDVSGECFAQADNFSEIAVCLNDGADRLDFLEAAYASCCEDRKQLQAEVARLREALNEVQQAQIDAATEGSKWKQKANEARDAARTLFTEDCQYRLPADGQARLERWPWLEESE